MRFTAILAALTATLLASAGSAAAAADWAPRMERVAACSWDRPGHNPFMGDVVAAIDRYSEIPTPVRMRLKQRMQARQYDDLVSIRRDEIRGRERYEPAIRDMHFGLDRVCRQLTRQRWTAQMHERGLVYCEQGHCILVPTVCRNVSRIDRRPTQVAGESLGGPSESPLGFEPPAAGPGAKEAQALSGAAPSPGPTATSSTAEAVAGAALLPWPSTGTDGNAAVGGTGIDISATWPPGLGPWPGWPTTSPGAATAWPAIPGAGGGHSFPSGGSENGEVPGGGIDDLPGSGSGIPIGSGGFPTGGGVSPIGDGGFPTGDGGFPTGGSTAPGPDGSATNSDGTPANAVPEPATWASLLAGLLALAGVSARRKARR